MYALHSNGQSITSKEILETLDETIPEHKRAADRIRHIERVGITYSNEDFDVLSYARKLGREAVR